MHTLFPSLLPANTAPQGFSFDIAVDIKDGPGIVLEARFVLDVVGVNPLETMSDVASSLNTILQDSGGTFGDIASSFGSSLGSVSNLFDSITDSDKIDLSLDAILDASASLDLSLSNFDLDIQLNQFEASFSALIADDFSIDIGGYFLGISPSIELNIEAINTATPFLFNSSNLSNLTAFDFSGDIDALVAVGVEGVPAEITLRASSDELVSSLPLIL